MAARGYLLDAARGKDQALPDPCSQSVILMSSVPPLDLLLTDATLLTADPRDPLIENALVGVSDGRFVLVEAASGGKPLPQARRVIHLAGRVITPPLGNTHPHAILTMVRGVAEDLGFAPAYTPGIPQGHMVTPDEAYAISRLGALEALLFGSTLINDTFVHADIITPARAAARLAGCAG